MIWGVAAYEFRMAVRRWGVWLAFALAALTVMINARQLWPELVRTAGLASAAGDMAFLLNLWMPLLAGISLADRLPRDRRLATDELIGATVVTRRQLVIGKYLGGLMSVALPVLVASILLAGLAVSSGVSVGVLPASALAFALVNLPPLSFVAAFSIACPAVLPVRVYQVLFTGYWFWGNFLNPKVLPTTKGTVLEASGLPQARAFLDVRFGQPVGVSFAVVNLVVLTACAVAILLAAIRYLETLDRDA